MRWNALLKERKLAVGTVVARVAALRLCYEIMPRSPAADDYSG
jgi:hypothetical protein